MGNPCAGCRAQSEATSAIAAWSAATHDRVTESQGPLPSCVVLLMCPLVSVGYGVNGHELDRREPLWVIGWMWSRLR